MIKTFEIIPAEDEFVMVDKNKNTKIIPSDWFYNSFCDRVEQMKDDDYGHFNPNNLGFKKIIAHTGIESLKDSNLPLFEIQIRTFDAHSFIQNEFDFNDDMMKNWENDLSKSRYANYDNILNLVEKAAGRYTEEDMLKAIAFGFGICHKENRAPFNLEQIEFLKSLKKYPTSAIIEMRCTGCDSTGAPYYFSPKVDKNNYIIITQFNYEI